MDENDGSLYQEEANELLADLLNPTKPKNQTQVRQLFIGNLPFRVRWQDIKDQFRKAGQVIRADVALNFDNRSKGHGTVLFATIEDAQKAIDMFDNFKWLGRVIEVRGDRGFVDTDSGKKSVTPLLKPATLPSIQPSPKQTPTKQTATKQTPTKQSKKQTTPKQATAKQPSTKHITVNQSPVKPLSNNHISPDKPSPKHISPKQPLSKQISPKQSSSNHISPKQPSPKQTQITQSVKKSSPKLVEAVHVTVKKIEHKEEVEEEEESDDDCKQLFVGNLPFQCQWQDLKDLFKSEGHILRADVVLNFDGRSRGFGTVLFANHKDAKQAIEKYNGFEFHNRILRVHFDKFAASHQRFREHEESTFGQRQIHDPESIELLRQTYSYTAPQPYTAYTSPYTSYGGGLDMYQGMIQAQPSFAYYSSQYNNAVYNGGYNTQQWVQPPLMQYPNEDLTSLSNSLDNVHLYNTPRNGDFSWTD
ncbi:hypothetical protein INT47_007786 [Mucor saturninus]|uniref:RRM domain-containing protein n=1 Tax=Mucor saturninus TaxID=64648 RepID=A0A8H7V7S4_9FUNG|nr:hypothetical protein INT47_007786 [Mucor saturninus]